jgi:hypothetical protein
MMILFPTVLNNESRIREMSVVAWTMSYDIGYMSSSMSRTLECSKAVNSITRTESNLFDQIWFLFKNKI